MPNSLKLQDLTLWQQTAFAAALLERMIPNYQMFAQAAEFGDPQLLRNQLDLIWQRLAQGQVKINFAVQLEKLELEIPDVDDFDFFGVHPALDTCMALGSLLQGIQDKDSETISNVSLLSTSSVSYYLGLLLAQEHPDQDNIVIQEQDIEDHPLMQWEIATQLELFNALTAAKENPDTCQLLKQLALSEGMSNLGIEI
ncbi:YjaG family protein [Colwelliaceae bacterium BS250]